jgi:hypothetical protein
VKGGVKVAVFIITTDCRTPDMAELNLSIFRVVTINMLKKLSLS